MKTIPIELESTRYPVYLGRGALQDPAPGFETTAELLTPLDGIQALLSPVRRLRQFPPPLGGRILRQPGQAGGKQRQPDLLGEEKDGGVADRFENARKAIESQATDDGARRRLLEQQPVPEHFLIRRRRCLPAAEGS